MKRVHQEKKQTAARVQVRGMVLPNPCFMVIVAVVLKKKKKDGTTESEAHLLLLCLIAAKAIYYLVFFPGGNIILSGKKAWLGLVHLTTLRNDLVTSA